MRRICLRKHFDRHGFSIMEAVIALTVIVVVTMAAIAVFDVSLDRAETGNDLGDARANFDNVLSAYQFAGTLDEFVDAIPDHTSVDAESTGAAVDTPESTQPESPPAHQHDLAFFSAVEASCLMPGYDDYYSCAGCGDWFSDEAGTQIIETHASVYHEALGHAWTNGECARCHAKSSGDTSETVGQFYDLYCDPAATVVSENTYGYGATGNGKNHGGVAIQPGVTRKSVATGKKASVDDNLTDFLTFMNSGADDAFRAVTAHNLQFDHRGENSTNITYFCPIEKTTSSERSYVVYRLGYPDGSLIKSFKYKIYGCFGMTGSTVTVNLYVTNETIDDDTTDTTVVSLMNGENRIKSIGTNIYGAYGPTTATIDDYSSGTYTLEPHAPAVYLIVEFQTQKGTGGNYIRYTGIELEVTKKGVDQTVYQVNEFPYQAATCTSDGHYLYYTCDNGTYSGKRYRDYACTFPYATNNQVIISAPGHNWWLNESVAAAPGTTGHKVFQCTRCGQTRTEYLNYEGEVSPLTMCYVISTSESKYEVLITLNIMSNSGGRMNGTDMSIVLRNKYTRETVEERHLQR